MKNRGSCFGSATSGTFRLKAFPTPQAIHYLPAAMKKNADKLRVALVGYGRMGQEIERLAGDRDIEITARYSSKNRLEENARGRFDVAIEFTHPSSVIDNIKTLLKWKKPIVVGTTGWYDRMDEVRALVEERKGRLLYASNFSLGVNIFFRIVREAARLFNHAEYYDAAVHEIHHTGKADAPSGTALTLGRIILEEMERKTRLLTETSHERIKPGALHVTSQRLGSVPGTHTVTFDSEADSIELTHRAGNRSGFALGSLLAARWLTEQKTPGVYHFADIMNSIQ